MGDGEKMNPLEDHEHLAALFSNVTTSMLDMGCAVAPDISTDLTSDHCTAVIPIPGEGGFTMAVTSDMSGCKSLAAAMFAVETTEVDAEMISDTMAELANMTAGQLKGLLQITHSLGLPVTMASGDFCVKSKSQNWSHYPMRAGDAKVMLSIATQSTIAEEYIGK